MAEHRKGRLGYKGCDKVEEFTCVFRLHEDEDDFSGRLHSGVGDLDYGTFSCPVPRMFY